MIKIVEFFCDVDDFCKVFIPQWEKQLLEDGAQKRQRTGHMTTSEIMTIVISFQMSHHCDFKNYYLGYVSLMYKSEFPKLAQLHAIFYLPSVCLTMAALVKFLTVSA